MGFHLTQKMYYFRLQPGDESVIGVRAFNSSDLYISTKQKKQDGLCQIRNELNCERLLHLIGENGYFYCNVYFYGGS